MQSSRCKQSINNGKRPSSYFSFGGEPSPTFGDIVIDGENPPGETHFDLPFQPDFQTRPPAALG